MIAADFKSSVYQRNKNNIEADHHDFRFCGCARLTKYALPNVKDENHPGWQALNVNDALRQRRYCAIC